MIKIIFLLSTVLTSLSVYSAQLDAKTAISTLLNGTSEKSPYQVLEGLFNEATPTQFSDIPTEPECEKGAHFVSLRDAVRPETRLLDLKTSDSWFTVNYKNFVIPASSVVPNDGPIFPGIPSANEILPNVLIWSLCPVGGLDVASLKTVAVQIFQSHYALTETLQGLKETDSIGGDEYVKYYRSIDGVIVEQISQIGKDSSGGKTASVSYEYYWRQ
jgi:hypothetical protein